MLKLTDWQQSVQLSTVISNSPPGDWTHMVRGYPVRLERRLIDPGGHHVVFFRGDSCGPYCGRWLASTFDSEATVIAPEQIKLF